MCTSKILIDLWLVRQKIKIQCLLCFSSEKVLIEYRENCLVINGKQNAKLKSGAISFKNYFKQIPVPFKIYADFEFYFKKLKVILLSLIPIIIQIQKKKKSFAYKVVCVNDKFSQKVNLYRGKDADSKFISSIINECNYCRRVIKKHFNRNLIMSAEEGKRFEMSNICWICNRLFDFSDNKVRGPCHISGKYRGAAHCKCNINLKLSKIPIMFHNLKGYDTHLIFKELSKFNVKNVLYQMD